jgi:hypothetical protein
LAKYIGVLVLLLTMTLQSCAILDGWKLSRTEEISGGTLSPILLVGPSREDELPYGKTLESVMIDFQPNVAEWSILLKAKNILKRPAGVAIGSEWQEFPQSQSQLDRWKQIIGRDWAPSEDNGIDINATGQAPPWRYGTKSTDELFFVTHFSPKYHKFHIAEILETASEPNIAVVRQDNVSGPPGLLGDNGGYSKYTLQAFKSWLARRKDRVELKRIGIEDIDAWDAGAALRNRRTLPIEIRVEDLLVYEYILFLNAENANFWRNEVRAIQKKYPNMPVAGNQGGWNNKNPTVYNFVLLSDISTVLFTENTVSSPYHVVNSTLPYRLFLAGGRHKKPLWTWTWDHTWHQNPMAYRIMVYEAWAQGTTPYLFLLTLAHDPEKGYYTLPKISIDLYEEGARLAKYARSKKELLQPAFRTTAEVAIIYSVPSLLPLVCGALGMDRSNPLMKERSEVFIRTAELLDREHVPYNIEIFGHPDLWCDEEIEQRLTNYRMIILPDVVALSNNQYKAIKRFEKSGGLVLRVGKFGLRNEHYVKREKPLSLEKGLNNIGDLRQSINRFAVWTSAPQTVWINTLKKDNGYQIHLFNRNHSSSGDKVYPAKPFEVRWNIPSSTNKVDWEAVWETPDAESAANCEINGNEVACTVTKLGLWGFVVIRPAIK